MSDRALDPELHTGLCNIYLKHYVKCIEESSLMSRLLSGSCEFLKIQMNSCFDKERFEKQLDSKAFQKKLKKEKEEEYIAKKQRAAELTT